MSAVITSHVKHARAFTSWAEGPGFNSETSHTKDIKNGTTASSLRGSKGFAY